jgi:serine/threonine-protein kinase
MGTVVGAVHSDLGRAVALKVRLRSTRGRDERLHEERFRLGARLQASLTHPQVAQVFDYFEDAAHQVMVLELLEGGSVETLVEGERPLPVPDAVRIAVGAAGALAHAHARGVVHRDVKPGNLLLRSAGAPESVQVTDFGVARALASTSDLTVAGANVGTLWYMPPEQFNQDAPTPLVDVYALGATTYEMLTGRIPFREASHAELFRRFLDREPPPPIRERNPAVPLLLAAVVEQALWIEPAERVPTVEVFATWLRAALVGTPAERAVDAMQAEVARVAYDRALEEVPRLSGALSSALASAIERLAEREHPRGRPSSTPSFRAPPTEPIVPMASATRPASAPPAGRGHVPMSIDEDDDEERTLVTFAVTEDES